MIDQLMWRPLFVMRLEVGAGRAQRFGSGPGARAIFPVDGGTFEGDRLRGRVLPDGADWVSWRADGTMTLDVRTSLETDDGALITLRYEGLALGRTPDAQARFERRELVDYEDVYWRTTPRFETADPRYAWLTKIVAVANGVRAEAGPIYHVFEIT